MDYVTVYYWKTKIFKKRCGSFFVKCDTKQKMVTVMWIDNKMVCLASSFISVDPRTSIGQQYYINTKTQEPISFLKMIKKYNSNMEGVYIVVYYIIKNT